MKEEMKAKSEELLSLYKTVQEKRRELKAMIGEYVAENRKFADGEDVLVCAKDGDHVFGVGRVVSAKSFLRYSDIIDIEHYERYGDFEMELNHILYEVMAIKTDGTTSVKHFFGNPNFISADGWHSDIVIKKTNTF